MIWKVVDIGTKQGGALDYFRENAGPLFGDTQIDPSRCLGVDREPSLKEEMLAKGYAFQRVDLTTEFFEYPTADYYLLFHVLEHLPTLAVSQHVLRKAFQACRRGMVLRLPSFEESDCARLRAAGLRFSWTRWTGHPTAFQMRHAFDVIPEAVIEWRGVGAFHDSLDERIVPVDAPIDTTSYWPDQGKKPLVQFEPPLIPEWELVVRKGAVC